MTTPVQPQTPTPSTTPTPSSAAPGTSTGAASPSPTVVAAEPWRAGPTAPSWAQGKTPEEILGLAVQLNDALGAVNQRPANGAPQPQNGNGGNGASAAPFEADAYVSGRELMAHAPSLVDQAVGPRFAGLYEMQAGTNLMLVKQDPKHADVFTKYGPEVNAILAQVPKERWSIDNLQKVVKMVAADHLDDLARLKAERLVADQGMTLRSSGAPLPSQPAPQPSNTLASEKIPTEWKERAAKAGITEATVREFCTVNNMTEEQFYSQFGNTVITEVTRRD